MLAQTTVLMTLYSGFRGGPIKDSSQGWSIGVSLPNSFCSYFLLRSLADVVGNKHLRVGKPLSFSHNAKRFLEIKNL